MRLYLEQVASGTDDRLLAGRSHGELERIWGVATAAIVQIRSPQPCEGLDITGVPGLIAAEVRVLRTAMQVLSDQVVFA